MTVGSLAAGETRSHRFSIELEDPGLLEVYDVANVGYPGIDQSPRKVFDK